MRLNEGSRENWENGRCLLPAAPDDAFTTMYSVLALPLLLCCLRVAPGSNFSIVRVFVSAETFCPIVLELPLIVLHRPGVRVFPCRLQFVVPFFEIPLLLWRILYCIPCFLFQ